MRMPIASPRHGRLGRTMTILLLTVINRPRRQIIIHHDSSSIIRIEKRSIHIVISRLSINSSRRREMTTRMSMMNLLASELSGSSHGAAVDHQTDYQAYQGAGCHAKVVDCLVRGGHCVSLVGEEGETASDEDVD